MSDQEEKVEESQVLWTDEHLKYLDVLRESGVTNMLIAVPYLAQVFDLSKADALNILSHWIKTFKERQREER